MANNLSIFKLLILVGMPFLFAIGCHRQASPELYSTAAVAWEEANKALENKDFSGAIQSFSAALEKQGLLPDQRAAALVARAECYARLGKFDEALGDLERAEAGMPSEQLYLVRSYVFAKQGKTAESQKELSQARAYNTQVRPLED